MADCCLIKKVATVEVYENKNEVRAYGFMAGDRNTPVMEVRFKHLWGESNLSSCKLRWIIVDDVGSLLVGEVPIQSDNTALINLPNELFTGDRRMKVQLTVASCDGERILNLQQFTDLKVINSLAPNEVVEPVYQILINTIYDESQKYLKELETSYTQKYGSLDSLYKSARASLEQYLVTAENGGNAEFLQGYSPAHFQKVENAINDLIASTKYDVGDVVEVLGYYSAGDGAGHPRIKKPEGYAGADAVIGADGSIWGLIDNANIKSSYFGVNSSLSDSKILLQKAIDYCVNNGFGLFLDSKVIVLSSPIELTTYQAIKIQGINKQRTKIICNNGFLSTVNHTNTIEMIDLKDLYLFGNKTVGSVGLNLDLVANNSTFENIFIQNFETAILQTGGFRIKYDTLYISECGTAYKLSTVGNNRDGGFINFYNCVFKDNSTHINIDSTSNEYKSINFYGVDLETSKQTSFIVNGDTQVNIFGGYIENNGTELTTDISNFNVSNNAKLNIYGMWIQNILNSSNARNFHKNYGVYRNLQYFNCQFNTKDNFEENCFTDNCTGIEYDYSTTKPDILNKYYYKMESDFSRRNTFDFVEQYGSVTGAVVVIAQFNTPTSNIDLEIEVTGYVEDDKSSGYTIRRHLNLTSSLMISRNKAGNLTNEVDVWVDNVGGISYVKLLTPTHSTGTSKKCYNFVKVKLYNSEWNNTPIKAPTTQTVATMSLNNDYFINEMSKLGILDSYHGYLKELHEHEKSQDVPDGVMNLNVLEPPVIPTEVEEYAKEYNLI